MKFHSTPLQGAYVIEPEKRGDERGFFARLYCEREFAQAGLVSQFVQMNNSLSTNQGTLRGMHYQLGEAAEVKLIRCVRGSLWDAILDLRHGSTTFGKWYACELSAENRLMMYAPKGFAHATLTLSEDTEAIYLVSNFYAPEKERGVRWNDPRFAIEWPIQPTDISPKDAAWRDFDPVYHLGAGA